MPDEPKGRFAGSFISFCRSSSRLCACPALFLILGLSLSISCALLPLQPSVCISAIPRINATFASLDWAVGQQSSVTRGHGGIAGRRRPCSLGKRRRLERAQADAVAAVTAAADSAAGTVDIRSATHAHAVPRLRRRPRAVEAMETAASLLPVVQPPPCSLHGYVTGVMPTSCCLFVSTFWCVCLSGARETVGGLYIACGNFCPPLSCCPTEARALVDT